jgi:adenylyltransferase/sulfurtransferase
MGPVPRRVLIVGMGGLGCPASLALARAGAAHLTLVDDDVVDVTNLHRQPWHHLADVGVPKVESAAKKLARAFPRLSLTSLRRRLDASCALTLFAEHDVVIDATDGVTTKFLLSDASVLSRVPLVYGGVLRFEGLAMRIEPGGPCLRCLFEHPPDDVPTCAQAGVLGSIAGLIGALQAELACAAATVAGQASLRVIDALHLTFRSVKVKRRGDCPACGEGANPVLKDSESADACAIESTSPARSAR